MSETLPAVAPNSVTSDCVITAESVRSAFRSLCGLGSLSHVPFVLSCPFCHNVHETKREMAACVIA